MSTPKPTDPTTPRLPPRANLEQLRKQAKRLLRDAEAGNPHAVSRLRAHRPSSHPSTLADAQSAVAAENGFDSWPRLVAAFDDGTAAASTAAAEPTNLGLGRIDQIGLDCTDMEAGKRFYGEILGLEQVGEVPNHLLFFQAGETRLLLHAVRERRPNSVIYFAVPGVDGAIQAAFERLKALGVRVGDPPHCIARGWQGIDAWLAFFEDPSGNQLALKSDVPTRP
jgi:catechol 2,3-dioxygenase-like lactoylglutathione lyase family enzyme